MTQVDETGASSGKKYWQCLHCPFSSRKRDHVEEHAEAKHEDNPQKYRCFLCMGFYKTWATFRQHKKRKHNM